MPNYVIRMKHTTATDVSIIHTATGMSTVYNNTGYLPPAGNWNMLTLNTPFLWNGTDNIVVDFAFGIVNPNYSSTGQCRVYTATNGYRHWQSDSVDQTTNFTGGAVLNTKPQIRMVFAPVVGNDPAIAVNPTTINETLVPDQSVQRTVTISNTGTATLNWQIGGMNSWVTVNTSSGNITAGQNQNISLSLTSDGLSDGVYNQTLTITSNATNNPNVNVNISMTVFNPFPNQPRYVAEFEPMAAALIRYPLGIPYTIVRELAADNLLYTVVSSANQTTAYNNYVSNNVNIANCRWIIAASDSYWIRDYGPWFIMDGNNEMKVVDFAYNRPRPTDDAIPAAVANNLGIGIYQSGIIHSGGNIMTDGEGKAMSTNLVLTENPSLTQSQVNMIMQNYLGVTEYQLYNDPNGTYINHIDCWAKILDVDKVMIRSVPPSHSQYGQIEAVVTSFQSKTSSWGTPYQIFRVNTPNNEPYSNAYILNKKIFVPLMNNANDAAAITAFQNAMPGYSVIGFLAGTNAWASTDAIHCRINAIPDQQMIHIHHIPPQNIASGITVEIETMITNHNALIPGDVYVAWRHNPTDPWTHTQMTNTSGILWAASIPTPDLGQTLYYMINAQDTSLRQRTVPLCGKDDPFKVLVTQVGYMPPPEPILNFTNDTASLSWTPIPHATFYEIYACDTPDGEFALIGTCNGVSWSEPLRTNVQTRFYQIKAIHLTE
ncbi:MAG: agmatine deiminase family protein [Candidatus Cloacimonetes bacterium]|nr:agmatine deiminase family protein [Candidatus Cloacimonadota bacterium]